MNKNILLTGGTGYLGSNILAALVEQGYSVVLIKRRQSSLRRVEPHLSVIRCYDIEDVSFEEVLNRHKISTIIHTATSYGRAGESLTDLINANLVFPVKLCEAAIKTDVNVFINTDTSLPFSVNNYSLAKSQFRAWLRKLETKINIINLIPEYFYGAGDDQWKLVTMIIGKLINNDPCIEFTDGLQQRDFIYIKDVVDAYLTILNNREQLMGWHDFSVCTGKTISIKEIALLCKNICNNTVTHFVFGAIPNRLNDVSQSSGDNTTLRNLGWTLSTDLHDGLAETVKKSY